MVRDVRYLSHSARQEQKLQRRPPSELAAKILWDRAEGGPLGEVDLLPATRRFRHRRRRAIGGALRPDVEAELAARPGVPGDPILSNS